MTMITQITRNLLRHAVGQAIWCPRCREILDVRRAVLVEIGKNGRCEIAIQCADCWDEMAERVRAIVVRGDLTLELTDGREIFNRTKRQHA